MFSDTRELLSSLVGSGSQAIPNETLIASIYRVGRVVAMIPPLALVAAALSWLPAGWGLVCLLVIAPATYLILLVSLRLGLGFALLAILFMQRLMRLPESVDSLTAGVHGLRGDVQALTGQVDQLRGNVTGLTSEVRGLPGVVDGLTSQVDSLYTTLESAQFWRVDKLVRRGRPPIKLPSEAPPEA